VCLYECINIILLFLKAAIIIQDSCFEVQNLLLLEGEAPPPNLSDYDVKRVGVAIFLSACLSKSFI